MNMRTPYRTIRADQTGMQIFSTVGSATDGGTKRAHCATLRLLPGNPADISPPKEPRP